MITLQANKIWMTQGRLKSTKTLQSIMLLVLRVLALVRQGVQQIMHQEMEVKGQKSSMQALADRVMVLKIMAQGKFWTLRCLVPLKVRMLPRLANALMSRPRGRRKLE